MKINVKKCIKIILIAFLVISIVNILFNTYGSYAQINPNAVPEKDKSNTISNVITKLFGIATGPLLGIMAQIINLVLLIVIQIICYIFGNVTNGSIAVTSFPFPDQIIYNKLAVFDPNFFNPSDGSVSSMISGVVAKFYYSFFIIAGVIFVISAMIIGIKLALSTIASEKAAYKEALTNWIMGFVLLFTVHFIMIGIFTINEKVVEIASKNVQQVEFKWNRFDAFPVIGKTLNSILKLFNVGQNNTDSDYGYKGLFFKYLWTAIGGDIISSIIFAILVFQGIALIFMYTKRLFYCFVLALLAPIIIAIDVIKKSSFAQKKSLFANWLQHFSIIVFTQSFQAILLTFSLLLLGSIQAAAGDSREGLVAIISIICTSAVITLEKTIKQLFGISDSFLGDAKSSAMKTMMGLGAAASLTHTAAEPFKDRINSRRSLAQGRQKLLNSVPKDKQEKAKEFLKKNKYKYFSVDDLLGNDGNDNKDSAAQASEIYNQKQQEAKAAAVKPVKISKEKAKEMIKNAKPNAATSYSSSSPTKDDSAAAELRKDREARKKEKLSTLVDNYQKDLVKYNKNGRERWLNLAGTGAAVGMGAAFMGAGMADNVETALAGASAINKPIDVAVTAYSKYNAERQAYAATGNPEFKNAPVIDEKGLTKKVEHVVKESAKVWLESATLSPIITDAIKRRKTRKNSKVDDVSDI